jgi:hypothetical protein
MRPRTTTLEELGESRGKLPECTEVLSSGKDDTFQC